jgi:hypothetical protein
VVVFVVTTVPGSVDVGSTVCTGVTDRGVAGKVGVGVGIVVAAGSGVAATVVGIIVGNVVGTCVAIAAVVVAAAGIVGIGVGVGVAAGLVGSVVGKAVGASVAAGGVVRGGAAAAEAQVNCPIIITQNLPLLTKASKLRASSADCIKHSTSTLPDRMVVSTIEMPCTFASSSTRCCVCARCRASSNANSCLNVKITTLFEKVVPM